MYPDLQHCIYPASKLTLGKLGGDGIVSTDTCNAVQHVNGLLIDMINVGCSKHIKYWTISNSIVGSIHDTGWDFFEIICKANWRRLIQNEGFIKYAWSILGCWQILWSLWEVCQGQRKRFPSSYRAKTRGRAFWMYLMNTLNLSIDTIGMCSCSVLQLQITSYTLTTW